MIYYATPDIAAALETLGARTAQAVVFTVAPRTPFLMTFWTPGQALPARPTARPTMVPACLRPAGPRHGRPADAGRARVARLLHLGMPGVPAMILRRKHVKNLSMSWLPFADAASEGLPLGAASAPVAVPGLGRHGDGAAARHAEPGDDRRAGRAGLGRGGDDRAAGADGAVPRRARLPVRHHRSALGWKRIPYLWFGSLWQMGGLAVMPFALIVLSGDQTLGPAWAGEVLAAHRLPDDRAWACT